ncbi:MAG: SdrD B-like domain-containing protein [Sulfurovum sp.]|nr:SdrD B-like domain-containing protein [Sulfurovum sp.]
MVSPEENNGFTQTTSLTGHIYSDVDSNGVQDAGEADLSGISVTIIDGNGTSYTVLTDSNGDYGVYNIALGAATVTIDTSSTSILNTSTQTEGTNPSTIAELASLNIVVGGNTEENNGFNLPLHIFTKHSTTENTPLRAGDTIDYNITLANTSSSSLTNVLLSDSIPLGSSYVPNSGKISYWVIHPIETISDNMTEDGDVLGYQKSDGSIHNWTSDWIETEMIMMPIVVS